jgi:hypothetical protein
MVRKRRPDGLKFRYRIRSNARDSAPLRENTQIAMDQGIPLPGAKKWPLVATINVSAMMVTTMPPIMKRKKRKAPSSRPWGFVTVRMATQCSDGVLA